MYYNIIREIIESDFFDFFYLSWKTLLQSSFESGWHLLNCSRVNCFHKITELIRQQNKTCVDNKCYSLWTNTPNLSHKRDERLHTILSLFLPLLRFTCEFLLKLRYLENIIDVFLRGRAHLFVTIWKYWVCCMCCLYCWLVLLWEFSVFSEPNMIW